MRTRIHTHRTAPAALLLCIKHFVHKNKLSTYIAMATPPPLQWIPYLYCKYNDKTRPFLYPQSPLKDMRGYASYQTIPTDIYQQFYNYKPKVMGGKTITTTGRRHTHTHTGTTTGQLTACI